MVSNTSTNKAPQKKAVPATAKRGGKVVAAATADDGSKRAAKNRTDDVAKKAVKKKADDMAKKVALNKTHDEVKKAAQKKVDTVAKEIARKRMVIHQAAQKKVDAVAKEIARKRMVMVADVAKKAAEVAARRVGKAMVAAASFKAASTVFEVTNRGYTLQMSDQTCAGVDCSHHLSSHIRPAKENTREGEENAEEPGLVQCKISSAEEKYNHRRGKIPVAPIVESNFLGLPIRPGEKDCAYYMRHGSCKYESKCRFNHPDPTAVEGSDAPSVFGNGGSGPSQGAFQQSVFSFSPPRTTNDTVPFVPVAFSPTQKVPPSNVEWDGYQNTTVVETPQQHSFLPTAIVAPSPTTTALSPAELSTTFDSRLSASPATADGTPLTSPILVEEDDPGLVKARQHRILREKMLKLCAQSCELEAAFEFVNTTVDYMCAEVDKMFLVLEEGDSVDEGIQPLGAVDPKVQQVNGLKKRVNLRRVGHRLRKKVVSKPSHLGQATRA